jgi:hypothetical protein
MMPGDAREHEEASAMALGRIARVLDERIDCPREAAGREQLILAATRRGQRYRARTVILLAAALAAALALPVAATIAVARKPAHLEYRLDGPVAAEGPWLGVAPSGGPLSMHFSDGTEIELGPGSKGRVVEVTGDGARVVLAAGSLRAHVVHRPRAHWTIAAGPYAIEVTGTAFEVEWSDTSAQLTLSLHDGSVVVRGPSLPEGLRVGAGQRLLARANTGEAQLSSLVAEQPREGVPVAGHDGGSTTPLHPAPRPLPTWSEMLAEGNFRGVLEAAEARGIDASLNRGSLADLVALADSARYLHDRALAKRGLLVERSRFAGSADARGAAFVLGRMADDGGSRDDAIRWYDKYLSESPSGPFAAEALGRKLEALVESGDSVAARSVATEYLRRFPHGAHRAYARDHVPDP